MGYLVCDKCGGFYELQDGESADDFDSCECGGKLEYKKTISHFNVAAQATGSEYFVLMKK